MTIAVKVKKTALGDRMNSAERKGGDTLSTELSQKNKIPEDMGE